MAPGPEEQRPPSKVRRFDRRSAQQSTCLGTPPDATRPPSTSPRAVCDYYQ
jgi:hypothetical protein